MSRSFGIDQGTQNGVGYLLSFAMPGLIVASAIFGRIPGLTDVSAFLPLVVAFCVVALVSVIRLNRAEPTPPSTPISHAARLYFRALPIAAVPAQIAALAIALEHWIDPGLHFAGRIGWLLSTGLFSALFAIPVAHELIHRRAGCEQTLGGILLSTACLGTFKIVHLHVHHRYVGTDSDFASARRGESLYAFCLRGLIGNPHEALRFERTRLSRLKRPLWRSELVVWYGLSVMWFALAILFWGWASGVFFLLQSLLAAIVLDWTNYIQHYGLRRLADAKGRYEPIRPQHAWTIHCRISNLALFNLLRHGDHHARPLEPYHSLTYTGVRTYPYPFGFMMLLALATPLFFRIVHPLLDELTLNAPPTVGH
jgi:alkane 1-monooxygenase